MKQESHRNKIPGPFRRKSTLPRMWSAQDDQETWRTNLPRKGDPRIPDMYISGCFGTDLVLHTD